MEKAEKKKKIVNPRPLFYGFLSLFFAICTARYVLQGNVTYLVLDGVVIVSFVAFCIFFRCWKTMALILSLFAFGIGWFCFGCSTFEGTTYSGIVTISGRISDDVSYSSYDTSVTVVLKDVKVNGKSESNISLTISYDSSWEQEIGDKISFEAELESVKLFTLGSFNSTYYRDRTPYTATVDSSDISVSGNSTTLAEKFRMKVKEVLYDNMSTMHASTAYAVLFGDKNDLNSDVKEAYNSAGVVHLLSVSGLHVSFLIALFGWVLKKCHVKGWLSTVLCGIFALVYASLCSFTPSVMRAGIMGVLLFSTLTSGKRYDALSSVGGAGLIILVISPLSALDLGFQLSFFCVISILTICPLVTKLMEKVFPKRIAQGFALTLSASLGIAPFVASMGGGANLLGFFTNLIVVPVFSVLFPLLFVSVLVVMCLPFMGFVLKASEFGFAMIYKFNQFMGQTELQVEYDQLSVFSYMFFYLALFAMSKFLLVRKDAKILLCTILFCLCAAVELLPFESQSQGLSYFNNYSQSVVVMTNSQNETIVVDLASSSFMSKVKNKLNLTSSTLVLLQDTSLNSDAAQELGAGNVVRSDSGEGFENEILVAYDTLCSVGSFNLVFRSYESRLIGLEVQYDDVKVFILKDRTASDEALASVSSENFDIVVLGKQTEYATLFSGEILTYYSSDNSFASFESDGNVFVSNNLKRRCLD